VSSQLPTLRRGLELQPSPVPDRPGLLVRDPLGYSETTLIIPPPLVPCLTCFDGRHSELDLRQLLVQATGDLKVGGLIRHLVETLASSGFLEDEVAARQRAEREREFRETAVRVAAHAGAAYPDEAEALRVALDGHLRAGEADPLPERTGLCGIAAPHVSLEGGSAAYGAAYRGLETSLADRTFVVLGTSHHGELDGFGLTRKPFVTPLGETTVDLELVDALEKCRAVRVEDYCHRMEHSIEFQVVFLQHVVGPGVRLLPILCGPFSSTQLGGYPEDNEGLQELFAALAEIQRSRGERLFWVLGIDLAHLGRRYGDRTRARAGQGVMRGVEVQDRERLARVTAGDAHGFWQSVQREGDPLNWCGSSPLYTFLEAAQPVSGQLLRYEQWNIDPDSVVSFAALAFHRGA
jgi:MEMO1 family protein